MSQQCHTIVVITICVTRHFCRPIFVTNLVIVSIDGYVRLVYGSRGYGDTSTAPWIRPMHSLSSMHSSSSSKKKRGCDERGENINSWELSGTIFFKDFFQSSFHNIRNFFFVQLLLQVRNLEVLLSLCNYNMNSI